jgi:hypothetical protein
MAYIGASPTTSAFVTDTFNGNGSTVAFTMSVAPANTTSIIVAVSGVLQDPSTYSVSGTTLTFSAAPPAGTGNISVRFLGIPASGVTSTAYRTQTEFTATAGQTTFSVPSYTVGFIDVYRNGALLGSADFTATNGTTVVLANPASSGDLVETVSFYVSSVLNAIPATNGAVTNAYLLDGSITKAKMAASGAWAPTGTVIQVVTNTTNAQVSTSSTSFVSATLAVSITPSSTSNKVFVIVTSTSQGSTTNSMYYTIYRGATNLGGTLGMTAFSNAGGNQYPLAMSYLDSPSTTSSTTYTVYFRTSAGSVFMGENNMVASITAMEIAG